MNYVKKIAKDKIAYGDLVVTSGLGGLYPKGINIGRIRDITAPTYETSLVLQVQPIIDFDRLEYLFLIGPEPESAVPDGRAAGCPCDRREPNEQRFPHDFFHRPHAGDLHPAAIDNPGQDRHPGSAARSRAPRADFRVHAPGRRWSARSRGLPRDFSRI